MHDCSLSDCQIWMCLSGSSFSFMNDDVFYVNIYNIYIYLQQ